MTDYRFTVHGPDVHKVVEWRTGAIDPGHEYLRAQTGVMNQGANVSDFDAGRDGDLPVEVHEGPKGVVDGIPAPVLGPVVKPLFDRIFKGIFG